MVQLHCFHNNSTKNAMDSWVRSLEIDFCSSKSNTIFKQSQKHTNNPVEFLCIYTFLSNQKERTKNTHKHTLSTDNWEIVNFIDFVTIKWKM